MSFSAELRGFAKGFSQGIENQSRIDRDLLEQKRLDLSNPDWRKDYPGGTGGAPKGGATGPAPSSDGAGGKVNTKEAGNTLMKLYTSLGYSPQGAAGIVGNLQAESGFNTGIKGDKGASTGLAQWDAARFGAMTRWAQSQGLNPRDLTTQARYVDEELKQQYPALRKQLMGAKDAGMAAGLFARDFERPQGSPEARKTGNFDLIHNMSGRRNFANAYFGSFDQGPGKGPANAPLPPTRPGTPAAAPAPAAAAPAPAAAPAGAIPAPAAGPPSTPPPGTVNQAQPETPVPPPGGAPAVAPAEDPNQPWTFGFGAQEGGAIPAPVRGFALGGFTGTSKEWQDENAIRGAGGLEQYTAPDKFKEIGTIVANAPGDDSGRHPIGGWSASGRKWVGPKAGQKLNNQGQWRATGLGSTIRYEDDFTRGKITMPDGSTVNPEDLKAAPRRYFVNAEGRRVDIGPNGQQTINGRPYQPNGAQMTGPTQGPAKFYPMGSTGPNGQVVYNPGGLWSTEVPGSQMTQSQPDYGPRLINAGFGTVDAQGRARFTDTPMPNQPRQPPVQQVPQQGASGLVYQAAQPNNYVVNDQWNSSTGTSQPVSTPTGQSQAFWVDPKTGYKYADEAGKYPLNGLTGPYGSQQQQVPGYNYLIAEGGPVPSLQDEMQIDDPYQYPPQEEEMPRGAIPSPGYARGGAVDDDPYPMGGSEQQHGEVEATNQARQRMLDRNQAYKVGLTPGDIDRMKSDPNRYGPIYGPKETPKKAAPKAAPKKAEPKKAPPKPKPGGGVPPLPPKRPEEPFEVPVDTGVPGGLPGDNRQKLGVPGEPSEAERLRRKTAETLKRQNEAIPRGDLKPGESVGGAVVRKLFGGSAAPAPAAAAPRAGRPGRAMMNSAQPPVAAAPPSVGAADTPGAPVIEMPPFRPVTGTGAAGRSSALPGRRTVAAADAPAVGATPASLTMPGAGGAGRGFQIPGAPTGFRFALVPEASDIQHDPTGLELLQATDEDEGGAAVDTGAIPSSLTRAVGIRRGGAVPRRQRR